MNNMDRELAALEEQRPIVEQYHRAITSPVWTDTIVPMLQDRKATVLDALIEACVKEAPAERLRALGAQVATVNWTLLHMSNVVAKFEKDLRDIQQQHAEDQALADDAQSVVESGRSNPFNPANPDSMET